MFLLKKAISPLLFPMPVCLTFLVAGLLLLWFTRRQKAGKIIVSIGALGLIFFSFEPISNFLLASLERRYPPFEMASPEEARQIKWIVVLSAGHNSDRRLPPTEQLSASSLERLVEAIHLYRELPGCRLVLSGGKIFDSVSEAEVLAGSARELGVNPQDIVLEADSRDTEDEARLVQPIVGANKFILVTSASHMPRAMGLFSKKGMNPLPAPTDYWTGEHQGIEPSYFYPSAGSMRKTERAVYEYLGLAWAYLRGKV